MEYEYQDFMKSAGFKVSQSSPCIFFHSQRMLRVVVHGDAFTAMGKERDLLWFRQQIKAIFGVKFRGMIGPEEKDEKEMNILNRKVRWASTGIEFQADVRHVEIVLSQVGLDENSKAVTTPCPDKEEIDETPLEDHRSTLFRAVTARLNYLALDRMYIQFAVKETL